MASKEHVIFLIDCQPSMLKACGVNDKDVRSPCLRARPGYAVAWQYATCITYHRVASLTSAERLQSGYDAEHTYAEVALIVARNIMKMHIISSSRDSFAVVLYGTVRCLCLRYTARAYVPLRAPSEVWLAWEPLCLRCSSREPLLGRQGKPAAQHVSSRSLVRARSASPRIRSALTTWWFSKTWTSYPHCASRPSAT